MTQQTRDLNKAKFEQGDRPQGGDYADLIDSYVALADTTAQTMTSDLKAPKFIATTEVSAVQVNASAATIGVVSAQSLFADTAIVSAATFTVVSAASIFIGGSEVLPGGAGASVEAHIVATAATSIGSTGTFELINGTYSAASAYLVEFEASTNGVVTYTGPNSKNVFATGYTSCRLVTGTNEDIEIRFAKNGTTLTKTAGSRRLANSSDIGAMSIGGLLTLVCGDTVDLRVANLTGTGDIEFEHVNIIVLET